MKLESTSQGTDGYVNVQDNRLSKVTLEYSRVYGDDAFELGILDLCCFRRVKEGPHARMGTKPMSGIRNAGMGEA